VEVNGSAAEMFGKTLKSDSSQGYEWLRTLQFFLLLLLLLACSLVIVMVEGTTCVLQKF